ncbi:CKLF-like MARVEL transmembrane domain-containing protein 7 isoform X2 [Ahaetulla prasina]|uniref:CKLF-like MARVEL transmembrane domain-containing protein 7 isoform X2 n=1 Tax=Ahaetulla prasina TaxID=499056 RepID=UPI0026471C39|nr:CKLF-like MARVEL transmembrane domain-containing protein 7 isoform X2 [Ahaetulla prasina]
MAESEEELKSLLMKLLLLIGFICVRSSQWTNHNAYSYFEIVCIYDLIMIFIFYIIYIFRAYRKLTCISWPLAEFLHYLIGTILLLIASIVAVAKSSNSAGLVAGAVFGFLATFICFLSIWLSYKVSCNTQSAEWWNGQMRDKFPRNGASQVVQGGGNPQASTSHLSLEEQLSDWSSR